MSDIIRETKQGASLISSMSKWLKEYGARFSNKNQPSNMEALGKECTVDEELTSRLRNHPQLITAKEQVVNFSGDMQGLAQVVKDIQKPLLKDVNVKKISVKNTDGDLVSLCSTGIFAIDGYRNFCKTDELLSPTGIVSAEDNGIVELPRLNEIVGVSLLKNGSVQVFFNTPTERTIQIELNGSQPLDVTNACEKGDIVKKVNDQRTRSGGWFTQYTIQSRRPEVLNEFNQIRTLTPESSNYLPTLVIPTSNS